LSRSVSMIWRRKLLTLCSSGVAGEAGLVMLGF